MKSSESGTSEGSEWYQLDPKLVPLDYLVSIWYHSEPSFDEQEISQTQVILFILLVTVETLQQCLYSSQ